MFTGRDVCVGCLVQQVGCVQVLCGCVVLFWAAVMGGAGCFVWFGFVLFCLWGLG